MAAVDRLTSLAKQLVPTDKPNAKDAILAKHPDDVVRYYTLTLPNTDHTTLAQAPINTNKQGHNTLPPHSPHKS
jgi:hypothetical protein